MRGRPFTKGHDPRRGPLFTPGYNPKRVAGYFAPGFDPRQAWVGKGKFRSSPDPRRHRGGRGSRLPNVETRFRECWADPNRTVEEFMRTEFGRSGHTGFNWAKKLGLEPRMNLLKRHGKGPFERKAAA